MEPLIADGAWCLFRLASVEEIGSRPMLVRVIGQDEQSVRMTIKDVAAEWVERSDGARECVALVLTPRNGAYPTMRIERETQYGDVQVVAELVEVLG